MIIQCEKVTKIKQGTSILKEFSWEISAPGIYAVLGPNGAGKTTMMQILAGLTSIDAGIVKVNGASPFENRKILSDICFIQESDNFKPTLTVGDVIKIVRPFYPDWEQELAEELLGQFQLPKKRRLKELSKGMSSALNMIIGIASRAALTIFDEPYIGMDAGARKHIYQVLLEDFMEHPRTILFSTHFIDETENLFESVCILKEGEKVFEEKISSLNERVLRIRGADKKVKGYAESGDVLHTSVFFDDTTAVVLFPSDNVPPVPKDLQTEKVSLQDFYIHYTDRMKEGEVQ
ncbi:ATP-binding cassette domain-containing protein [Alkalicoccus daliensis]|uniref:ABC-2 type transport system ATP-binding protein n=1 Tax=Alkalicoccus daliensis TaxID=745820 RepID=A0A1G9ZD03_9BACI|nr:ABC transporter ATP-binding protein [Alkalicoccus daliensis]SDN19268.1 ABC-2 type transport system ATP-binding protein [Alkalicoccus daliensis]